MLAGDGVRVNVGGDFFKELAVSCRFADKRGGRRRGNLATAYPLAFSTKHSEFNSPDWESNAYGKYNPAFSVFHCCWFSD